MSAVIAVALMLVLIATWLPVSACHAEAEVTEGHG